MPTISDGLTAMRTLQSHLQARLNADFAATFTDGSGGYLIPDVVLEDDEPQDSDTIGKPFAVLALGSDDSSEWSDVRGRMRICVIEADCVASDFSGAQTGTANPTGSDTLLSQAIGSIINDDYVTLRDMGLLGCAFRTNTRERIEATDAGEIHHNPHRITFTYERP